MRHFRSVLLAVPMAALACSSSLTPSNGPGTGSGGGAGAGTGSGGGAGDVDAGQTFGGSGGRGGSGGSGGSTGGISGQMPSCLRDLIAGCPLAGACQKVRNASGRIERSCFASGETVAVTYPSTCTLPGPPDPMVQLYEVHKADGSLCYSYESVCYCGSFCENSNWTWRNAAGAVVATGTIEFSGHVTVTCAGDGETCQGGGAGSGGSTDACRPAIPGYACADGSCGGAGGNAAVRCPLVPQIGSSCTEDCSWDAVAANTSYCCPIKGAINTSEALVAECQGYKVLLKRGLDAGVVKYYDATTGALVASATTGASPCGSEPIATPPGCTLGTFAKLPQWCEAASAPVCADGGA